MVNRIGFGLVLALLCACSLVFPVAAEDKDDAGKDVLKKIQGTWTFVSMEQDGNQAPKGDEAPIIIFKDDKFTVKLGDKVVQAGTHKFDPTKTPKTVDANITEGEGKGTTMLGIYEMEGDTIKVCFDPQGKKRPTEFKAPAGSGLMLAVVKRADKK